MFVVDITNGNSRLIREGDAPKTANERNVLTPAVNATAWNSLDANGFRDIAKETNWTRIRSEGEKFFMANACGYENALLDQMRILLNERYPNDIPATQTLIDAINVDIDLWHVWREDVFSYLGGIKTTIDAKTTLATSYLQESADFSTLFSQIPTTSIYAIYTDYAALPPEGS